MSYNSRVELLREEIDKLTEKLKVSEEVRLAQAAHIVRLMAEAAEAAKPHECHTWVARSDEISAQCETCGLLMHEHPGRFS